MVDEAIQSIVKHVQKEPFARKLGLRLLKVEPDMLWWRWSHKRTQETSSA